MEPRFGEAQPGVFYLDFGDILIAESTRPMLGVDCHIWYASEGSAEREWIADACWRDGRGAAGNLRSSAFRDARLQPDSGCGFRVWDFLDGAGDGNAPGDAAIQKQQWGAGMARVDRYAQLRIYFFLPEATA